MKYQASLTIDELVNPGWWILVFDSDLVQGSVVYA
jgi:hypothetical protein